MTLCPMSRSGIVDKQITKLLGKESKDMWRMAWNKIINISEIIKKTTIDQIKRKEYPTKIADYTGDILLVGINYDKESKQHTCKIESNYSIGNVWILLKKAKSIIFFLLLFCLFQKNI